MHCQRCVMNAGPEADPRPRLRALSWLGRYGSDQDLNRLLIRVHQRACVDELLGFIDWALERTLLSDSKQGDAR